MGFYTGLLLKTLASTASNGASAYAQSRGQPQPTRRRTPGCRPCEAYKQVDKAKRAAGVKVLPPLTPAQARKLGAKV